MEEMNMDNLDFENQDTLKDFKKFEGSTTLKKKSRNKKNKSKDDRSVLRKILGTILDWLIALGIAIILTILITSVISQGKISGSSMSPTYSDKEHILVQRSFYSIERGDVITFWADKQPGSDNALTPGPIRKVLDEIIFHQADLDNKELHIKRVMGLPGDHIVVKNVVTGTEDSKTQYRTKVYVNDELVAFSDIENTPSMDITLGEGEYFVIGDNYDNSYDSRYHGPVEEEDVFGEVINARPNAREINENEELVTVTES